MIYTILVPSGIGDFSWLWSKLATTKDQFYVMYIGGAPDRMRAFLNLLPKDRILGFIPHFHYATRWNNQGELVCFSRDPAEFPELPKMQRYSDLDPGQVTFVECNTHLEHGNRLETWMQEDIPGTDFHYKINFDRFMGDGIKYFVVNFSSYGTKKAWGYYDVEKSAVLVKLIYRQTGWYPMFIGGDYDDYTKDICALVKKTIPALDKVGKTPRLEDAVDFINAAQMYFGACSGLMALSNILNVPVCTYYPPFETPPGRYLSGTWHDQKIPYESLFWEGIDKDKEIITAFLAKIEGEARHGSKEGS